MTISAQIIEDSISPAGVRLTTFQLRYPRFIHAELMTHRVFSRNASSSRAIPVERLIQDMRDDVAWPIYWGSNQKGMQAGAELSGVQLAVVKSAWIEAMEFNIRIAQGLMANGLHKQLANRLLEPWAHINVVLTATDYENWFTLRCHKDAQPEIQELANKMLEQRLKSTPNPLKPGEWHLPYIHEEEFGTVPVEDLKKVSVARCARTSYLTHDGRVTTLDEDRKLFDRLVGSQPLHASPAEHQATPDDPIYGPSFLGARDHKLLGFQNESLHGNLRGWIQYRKMLPGEFIPG